MAENSMVYLAIPDYKKHIKALPHVEDPLGKINFRINNNTGKMFAYCDTQDGQIKIKVQQALDPKLPVRYMYSPEELFSEGCIINVKESEPDLFSI
jgi:hypothetical protein